MTFEFFQLLTDEQARELARQEERAKPPPDIPPQHRVKYKTGIYRFRTDRRYERNKTL